MRTVWLALALACLSCGTPRCPPGLSRCDDLCVDTSHSELHCGACYNPCLRPLQCTAGACQLPACSNGIRDGAETATDCGGPDCPHCAPGEACSKDSDCQSAHCNQAAKTCSSGCEDGVKDGNESDVDCGSACPLKCTSGRHCNVNADCAQGICFGDGVCRVEGFTLASDRTVFYAGANAVAHLTASYLADGEAVGNAEVVFSADFGTGTFVDADGGSLGRTVTGHTDPNGVALVDFSPAQVAGVATVSAQAHGNYATVALKTLDVQAPVWVSTTCDGGDCSVMGPGGDGYNDEAIVTFQIVDQQGAPLPGIPIAFSVPNTPTGSAVDPAGVSDQNGRVATTLHSGHREGIIYVWATEPGGRAGTSHFITVTGVKATNDWYAYSRFSCAAPTLPALAAASPPAPLTDDCQVVVSDRYGNPMRGQSMHVLSEAGSVPATVTSDQLGVVSFTFSTLGPLPADVPPLAALSSNGPLSLRDAEPFTDAGTNPRDGLVTLVLYGFGDEYLYDANGNSEWDPNERFVDQGEPLVDSNDDGEWTPGEVFVDTNGNGVWDRANGVWDRNTTVWVDTQVLFWGAPTRLSLLGADYGVCPGGVGKDATFGIPVSATDDWLNKPFAPAVYSVTHTASKGSVVSAVGNATNGPYGFTDEVDVASPDGGMCSSGPCEIHRYFEHWSDSLIGNLYVHGAAAADTTGCENDTLTFTITVNGLQTQISTTGAIQ